MAFNLGFVRLCDRNIQHIYTTNEPKPPARRKKLTYKPEFLVEQARKMRQRELNRRYMEYVPKHDIELPKAPAFRTLQRDYIDTVVDRLTKPARERFNFKYPINDVYNDWNRVERERKQKIKEILDKLDGKTSKDKKKKKKEKDAEEVTEDAPPEAVEPIQVLPPIADPIV